MLHRGPIIGDRLDLRSTSYAVGAGGVTTITWDPREYGGRLDINLSSFTYTASVGTLYLKLAASYVPTPYEELEVIYRGFGGGPLTVDASGTDGLCSSSVAGDASLAPGLTNELIRLQYINGAYRVVERRGMDVDWSTLDIIDSLTRPYSVTTINGGSYPLFKAECSARIDAVAVSSHRALIGGSFTAFSPFAPRLAIGFFDGGQVYSFATCPTITDGGVTCIHMYSSSQGIASVSSSPSGVADKVLVTADGGDNWTSAGDIPTSVSSVDGVVGGYNSSTRMLIAYCKDAYNRIFVSTDGGTTWAAEALPLATDRLKAITHANATSKQFIAVGHDGSLHGRIWRRSVAAAGSGVWSLVISDATVDTIVQDVSYDMAVGDSGRVWFTPDDGATWVLRPTVEMSGYTLNLKQVKRGSASGQRVYYVHASYNDVGHVLLSMNTGRDFYSRGQYVYGTGATCKLGILGGDGGNLALFPDVPFGFTVYQRAPSDDRVRSR